MPRDGGSRSSAVPLPNCGEKGQTAVTEDHEHDEGDEAAQAPASTETVLDEEQAEEEAHEAEQGAGEAEDADTGEGEQGEGERPAPGTHASAKQARDEQKMIEKMFDQFDREAKRHSDRVSEIGGESAQDLLPCPMCSPDEGQPRIPGFLLPVKPSDEKISLIRTAIGLAPKVEYREDPYSKVCPVCGGFKVVLPAGAGENIPPLSCAECNSLGWLPVGEKRGGAPENGASAEGLTGPTAPLVSLEADPPEVAALKARGYTVIEPFVSQA